MQTDMKTYAGIDYGNGRTNIDPQTGLRFGVISQNSIMPEAFDDIFQSSRDLTYEASVAEFKQEIARIESEADLTEILKERFGDRAPRYTHTKLWAEAILVDYTLNDGSFAQPLDDEAKEYIWNEIEQTFNDYYEDNGERDWLYEKEGYKLTNCLQSDVFVLASPYYTYAQFCSPCVPGACNLDSPLDHGKDWQVAVRNNRAFCLGHDWFEGDRAPYPVYSVATGELIAP